MSDPVRPGDRGGAGVEPPADLPPSATGVGRRGRVSPAGLARSLILAAAGNRIAEAVVARYGMRLGASRFVAGETMDECVAVIRGLNREGLRCNATVLGEAVRSRADADQAVRDYQLLLARLADEQLTANVAVKLTLLGLEVGAELAEANLTQLLDLASPRQQFVRIDMEESRHVEATLGLYRRLRTGGVGNVGTVLQAYLYRTASDLESLLPLGPNLRLVKGAYRESPQVAFPRKADVDRSYVQLMERALTSSGYTAIATHDEAIIEHAIGFTRAHRIGPDRFEFQMLYGVRPQLQRSLVARGFPVLVATSFGTRWYPFFMRRLAERPANLLFLGRNLLRR